VFVENKTKVASRVGCSELAVLYFTELLFKSNKKKFSFRRVESEKIGEDTVPVISLQMLYNGDEVHAPVGEFWVFSYSKCMVETRLSFQ